MLPQIIRPLEGVLEKIPCNSVLSHDILVCSVKKMMSRKESLLLSSILLAALLLRSYGLEWTVYNAYNPDEMHFIKVAGLMLENKSLNPYRFSYPSDWPTLPLYLLLSVSTPASFFTELSGIKLHLLAKCFSVALSTLTVYLTYVLGRRAYDSRTGLLAAAFLSVTLLHVKDSHFYIHEIVYTLLSTWTLIYCLDILRKGEQLSSYLKAGILAGLVSATAFTGYLLGFPIIISHYIQNRTKSFPRLLASPAFMASIILLSLIPLISNPYSLLSNYAINAFIDALRCYLPYIPQFLGGNQQAQFAIPFEDTIPYVYHLKTLLYWGMGPLLEAVVLLGCVYSIQKRRTEDILLLSWTGVYFLLVGLLQLRFDRYMLPLTPPLCILGAMMLTDLKEKSKNMAHALIFLTLCSSLLYVLAYENIYSTPGTRILASEWITENIKAGSTILVESDYIAYSPPIDTNVYNLKVLDFYHLHYSRGFDTGSIGWMSSDENLTPEEKGEYIRGMLCGVDYIVTGDRNYPAYLRLREKYPIESGYFTSLFSGDLGFRLLKYYRVYPNLLGVQINDSNAELSFRLMDHPEVRIYENINQNITRFCESI